MRFAIAPKMSMGSSQSIAVEVCHIGPQVRFLRSLQVALGTTIGQALEQSGIYAVLPELAASAFKVGIYSKLKTLDTVLREHDRIEIYRPLLVDPMTARRARANKKAG